MKQMRKSVCLTTAVLLICVLGGCAGLGLLTLVFRAIAVGQLIGQISDFFGHDSTEFTLFLDGYNTGVKPNPSGALDLTGLPPGHHLLTVATDDRRLGFHLHVFIVENQSVNLGEVTPIQGGIISGRVTHQVGDAQVPMPGVLVAAVLGGGEVIRAGTGRQVTLPPISDTDTVIMGFTDANGNYRLGPASFGQWIVTTAYAGQYADAVLANVAALNDANDVNLALRQDPTAAAPGSIQGTVVRAGGGAIDRALVQLVLGSPLAPLVDPTRAAALESQVGPLLDQPWFLWSVVATETNSAGGYSLAGPAGDHEVLGFKYGFRAQSAAVTLNAGEVVTGDFTLEER